MNFKFWQKGGSGESAGNGEPGTSLQVQPTPENPNHVPPFQPTLEQVDQQAILQENQPIAQQAAAPLTRQPSVETTEVGAPDTKSGPTILGTVEKSIEANAPKPDTVAYPTSRPDLSQQPPAPVDKY